jgi:hypothetical protein
MKCAAGMDVGGADGAGGASSQCLSENGLFARSLRYTQKFILGISTRCLW